MYTSDKKEHFSNYQRKTNIIEEISNYFPHSPAGSRQWIRFFIYLTFIYLISGGMGDQLSIKKITARILQNPWNLAAERSNMC